MYLEKIKLPIKNADSCLIGVGAETVDGQAVRIEINLLAYSRL